MAVVHLFEGEISRNITIIMLKMVTLKIIGTMKKHHTFRLYRHSPVSGTFKNLAKVKSQIMCF